MGKKNTSGNSKTATPAQHLALSAHSIPMDAPMHGRPPARFMDGEVLAIQYRTDPAAIAALLPPPLESLNDVVMVQIARWGDVPGMGRNTYEANIMVAARFKGPGKTVIGAYSPYFYVDNDRAMVAGREFHGQPKRHAIVKLEARGDVFVGEVIANGLTVFTGTMHYKARRAKFEDVCQNVNPVTNINLKIMPHIHGGYAVRQLTARDFVDMDITECFTGTGTAEVHPHATIPMYKLPVREQMDAFYWCGDFSLIGGVVLHDYLPEQAK
jgi:acetoacetate decarboxylase